MYVKDRSPADSEIESIDKSSFIGTGTG